MGLRFDIENEKSYSRVFGLIFLLGPIKWGVAIILPGYVTFVGYEKSV